MWTVEWWLLGLQGTLLISLPSLQLWQLPCNSSLSSGVCAS
jgi:hypothetical protein